MGIVLYGLSAVFLLAFIVTIIINSLNFSLRLFSKSIEGAKQPFIYIALCIITKRKRRVIFKYSLLFDFRKHKKVNNKKVTKKKKNFIKFADIAIGLKVFISKTSLEKFKISLSVGTDDSSQTAMLCGLFYCLFGSISAVVANSFSSYEEVAVSAIPNFNKVELKYEIDCIIKAKLADIILVIVRTSFMRVLSKTRKTRKGELRRM